MLASVAHLPCRTPERRDAGVLLGYLPAVKRCLGEVVRQRNQKFQKIGIPSALEPRHLQRPVHANRMFRVQKRDLDGVWDRRAGGIRNRVFRRA